MEGSRLARFVLETAWVFPALETLHFFGLILLIGSMYVVDLRFMGLARRIPLKAVLPFIPVSMAGFGINLVTGTLFLFSDPSRYYSNFAFRLKMLAILLAGLNAIWFKIAVHADILSDTNADPRTLARWIAGLSMLLWTTVIVLGRMIPYLE
ncbi:MAG: hypothetical protein WD795_06495 [Woeseia sp.]